MAVAGERLAAQPVRRGTTDELARVWQQDPGFFGWLTVVNHKNIGLRFIATGFAMFVLAGLLALLMRLQLAWPQLNIISPQVYNQVFTMHGTTMMFLFAVPIMEGIGIYLVPLMLGARDMAFPRLNAFGYWVYLIAGITLYVSLILGIAPDAGWFNYVPLASREFSPGLNIDFYATLITFLEVSALVAAVELIATVFKCRAPGMTLNRMPLFVWSQLVMSFMIVFAMPLVMAATAMLALDRTVGTHFYRPELDGNPVLWQHLFWAFGHPEVYIILVPGLGIISMVVATMARHANVGYLWLVLSFVAVGFLSFGLWVHHMFAVGLPLLGMNFFAAASSMITITSGIQVFSWIATIWAGRPRMNVAFLWILGFFFVFIRGGITGVMVASVPFDWQVHDTYFVVAHLHDVLIGGAVFPLLAGIYYWYPKVTGRFMSERLGLWNFWLVLIGYNITFFTMYLTGFAGMPRRVYSYLPDLGWNWLNLISTAGAVLLAAGFLLFFVNLVLSSRRGAPAGRDPWGGNTLEWSVASPPPPYNFRTFPIVRSRNPLWDQPGWDPEAIEGGDRILLEADRGWREQLGTTLLDARPESRIVLPASSIWPLLTAAAVAVIFIGVMFDVIFVPIGALLVFITIFGWTYPRKQDWERDF
jgi:cytochrome c oxidase subunit I+III